MKNEDATTTLKLQKFLALNSPEQAADDADESVSGLVARAVAQAAAADSCRPTTSNGLPENALLGVLTYCYAKGTYGSGEIAEKLRANAEARRAAGDALPDSRVLRRFRRNHRGLLQCALERALRLIRRTAMHSTMTQTLPGSTPLSVSKSGARRAPPGSSDEGTTTFFVRCEAQRKIEAAAITDTALDD